MSYRKYLMTDDVPPSELYKTVKIDTDSDTISRQAEQMAFDIITKVPLELPPAQRAEDGAPVNCPMRHKNGNCLPAGGFCTANKSICEALHHAYEMGKSAK